MRPMTIAAGTIMGVAGAYHLGYRKNAEEAEIERQLLLKIEQKVERQITELGKLVEKVDELKEKVDCVCDLLKQGGDLPKQVGDLPKKKGSDLEDV